MCPIRKYNQTGVKMNEMFPMKLVKDVEDIIKNTINKCYPQDWDEDFITRSLLISIREKLDKIQLDIPKYRKNILCSTYKQTGKVEYNFGDIGILVKIIDNDSLILEGAGFIESKKKYTKSDNFDKIESSQLARILEHAPKAMLLLYDYELIDDFTHYQLSTGHYAEAIGLGSKTLRKKEDFEVLVITKTHPFSGVNASNAISMPISIAQSIALKNNSLYRYGMPFSLQLCLRYLNGFDLEFSREALRIAKGWSNFISPPQYLMTMALSEKEIEKDDESHIFEINYKKYEHLVE